MLSNANSDLPWEQQALHLVIETVQEALHDKSPAEQQSLQAALMTLRGFLAASRLTHEEGGTSWEPFLEPIAPSDMSRIGAWSQTLRERREAASSCRVFARVRYRLWRVGRTHPARWRCCICCRYRSWI